MSIKLHVSLLSGRTVQIETGQDVDVGAFKRRALKALSVRKGRLVNSTGFVLDEAKTIGDSELCNDESLKLLIHPTVIQANRGIDAGAFAVILGDGSVVMWGNSAVGGDGSALQDQLKNVKQIQANLHAFAAILADGSVVTWGSAAFGGDSSAVQDQLRPTENWLVEV